MSSESDKNTLIVKFELPQIINTALTPLANAIGTTLAHGWNGMTMELETWYDKKVIDHDENLKLYKEKIQQGVSNLSEDNLQTPSMNIIGPAFEASKYYFEEKQYREMFARLIVSSCDKSKNPYIHPSFVETIKQMTALEAKILSTIDIDKPLIINVFNSLCSENKHQ